MPKRSHSIPLSVMSGGINRKVRQAGQNQVLDGEDIIASDGDLRRRPSFSAILQSAPFRVPSRKTYMFLHQSGVGFTDVSRVGTISTFSGGTYRLLVGCEEIFDGIDFSSVDEGAPALTRHSYLCVRMLDASDDLHDNANYTEIPWALDTTYRFNSSDWGHPLMGAGQICWHSAQLSAWVQTTVNSVTAYWVALDITAEPKNSDKSAARTIVANEAALRIDEPGAVAFHLEKVVGIVPIVGKRGNAIVIQSDREGQRGQENGAAIAIVDSFSRAGEVAKIVEDEGSGILGTYTAPTWSGSGTGGGTYGTAGMVTKNDDSYDWLAALAGPPDFAGQWGRQTILESVGVDTAGSTTYFETDDFTYERDNEFEHCMLECTTSGGGPSVGERRIVQTSEAGATSNVRFDVSPAWSGAPTGTTVFKLLSVPYTIGFSEKHIDSTTSRSQPVELIANTNTADTITVEDIDSHKRANDQSINNEPVHFYIGRETRWDLTANGEWGYMFDPVQRRHLFCNGKSAILEFDGRRFRRMTANSNPTSALVELWTGILHDQDRKSNTVTLTPGSFIRSSPPIGRYLEDWAGRIVVTGDPGDPQRVYWSAPGEANDIWPKLYETIIRDSQNQGISGMRTLNQNLAVWTPNSIFFASIPNELGMFYFAPVSQHVGFVSNAAVERIPFRGSQSLIGPNADGVYVFNGAETTPVLDEWDRVVKGGVNISKLSGAVASADYYNNLYYLAVPSARSQINDTLLVYDWIATTWYQWTAPFGGISSISTMRNDSGSEVVLFGHYDGTVSVLTSRVTDDGDTITGRARSVPISFDNITTAPTGLMLQMFADQANLTVRTFLDQKGAASQSGSLGFTTDEAVFGTDLYGTGVFSGDRVLTKKLNQPSGSRATQLQYEIEGSARWRLRNAHLLLRPIGHRSGA